VGSGDILVVDIKDEEAPEEVLFRFRFAGRDLAHKNSIHFDAVETAEGWKIKWRGATPM